MSLNLMFDGTSLIMRTGGGQHSWPARSGKSEQGIFNYGTAQQKKKNYGPIPEGLYYVIPDEYWERDFLTDAYSAIQGMPWTAPLDLELDYDEAAAMQGEVQRHRQAWGNERLSIHAERSTRTHGRDGFFIHGGTDWGSIGCIDLTSHMPAFGRAFRKAAGGMKKVPLRVQYATTSADTP